MKIQISDKPGAAVPADLLVVGAYEGGVLGQAAAAVDKALDGHLRTAVRQEMKGCVGDWVLVHTLGAIRPKRVVIVGLGPREKAGLDAVRNAMSVAVRTAQRVKAIRLVSTLLLDLPQGAAPRPLAARAVVEGAALGSYSFRRYLTNGDAPPPSIDSLTLLAPRAETSAIAAEAERGRILAEAASVARDMISEPAGYMTPSRMAEIARGLSGLTVTVFDEKEIERLGMGAFRGVSLGSAQPPRFIKLLYRPAGAARSGPIDLAFVGKGITFDSGGINLKPTDGIGKMKYDMSGGAAVIAAMSALPALEPNVSVLGLVPCTENMPSGSAIKPGDILRTLSGKTVEVENTDAEGRLVLADALTYAIREGARALVDVATLTGAVVIALGRGAAGLMGNDTTLKDKVRRAATLAGERVWELPLYDDYLQLTQSDVADLKNTGGREGSTITAGLFLQEFVEDTPWVHLDIASTAWADKDSPGQPKGPTGFAVRTLLNLALEEGTARPAGRARAPAPAGRGAATAAGTARRRR